MSVDRCSATRSSATRAIESTNGEPDVAGAAAAADFFDVARFWLSAAAAAAACLAIRLSSAFAILRESAAESAGAAGVGAGDDVGAVEAAAFAAGGAGDAGAFTTGVVVDVVVGVDGVRVRCSSNAAMSSVAAAAPTIAYAPVRRRTGIVVVLSPVMMINWSISSASSAAVCGR